MLFISAAELAELLPYRPLIEVIRAGFRRDFFSPPRHLYRLSDGTTQGAILGLMPAWDESQLMGIKLATLFHSNAAVGLPTHAGLVLLFDRKTGKPAAVLDGAEITLRRTAAASALAADYLARADAEHLAIIGTGSLAPHLAVAHAEIRPIRQITICGRTTAKAKATAAVILKQRSDLRVETSTAPELIVPSADIVSCATTSSEPILRGEWVRKGTHVDLVGAFSPTAREADSELIRRARIYADVSENVLREAGDILIPIAEGSLPDDAIQGDLMGLTRGRVVGRMSQEEITVFKSVGTAIEDVIAAGYAFQNLAKRAP